MYNYTWQGPLRSLWTNNMQGNLTSRPACDPTRLNVNSRQRNTHRALDLQQNVARLSAQQCIKRRSSLSLQTPEEFENVEVPLLIRLSMVVCIARFRSMYHSLPEPTLNHHNPRYRRRTPAIVPDGAVERRSMGAQRGSSPTVSFEAL